MRKIFFYIFVLFFCGCNKEKQVSVPVHVDGWMYVNKKMSKSEYIKIMQEKEREELETRRKIIEMQEFYKKQKDEWSMKFETELKNEHDEIKIIYPNHMEIVDVKSKPEKQEAKIVYQAKGITIKESK